MDEKTYKKFLQIDEEWRGEVDGANTDRLKEILITVAQNEQKNQDAKEQDQDLAEKKAQKTEAEAGYKEATKMNNLKIKYILNRLGN